MENKLYYKIGANIRGLRTVFGLSQEELALEIGISKQAVSKYEMGDGIPKRDHLIKIAKYFKITENELLNKNYTEMKEVTSNPINDKWYNEQILKMFPLICTDVALGDEYFKIAYELHETILYDILNDNDFDVSVINQCIEYYEKASGNGISEGIANRLWWMMFYGCVMSLGTPKMIKYAELLCSYRISIKEFFKKGFLDFDDDSDEYREYLETRAEFIKENKIEILACIRCLKLRLEYADLGDYYLALMYLFDLIDNTESAAMNRAIGYNMLNTYYIMGNPYVRLFEEDNCEKES